MKPKPLTVGELREFLDRENVPNSALLVDPQEYCFCMRCNELYLDKDGDVVLPDECKCDEDECEPQDVINPAEVQP